MDTSREYPPATPTASTAEGGAVAASAGLEPTARIENEMRSNDPSFPTLPTSPVSSSMRKAQVRAALFHKLVPVKIGRFTLLERLGAGSMGEIYAAYDDRLDRAVALKLVRHGSDHTVKADELLLREAQALAQVSHPNVVQIYEAGTHGGRMFIAMELIRGCTLTSWLEDAAQLPRPHRQRETLRLFIAAGRGLEAAHSAGVAHRDFKPDNVLVGKDGRVCVVDFGLARVLVDDPTLRLAPPARDDDATVTDDFSQGETMPLEPAEPADAPSDGSRLGRLGERDASSAGDAPKRTAATRLTRTGTVMGTPRFMAPEQIRGGVPDHRSDQFSFCVALYHALYGAFPFNGEDQDELLDSIRTGVTGLEHSVGFGARLRKALCRGLSVDPSQRFPSMGELLAALEPGLRRRRGWIAGAVLLFIALGAAGYVWHSPAADPCATSGDGIAAAWSPARRTAIQATFARSDLPYAEAALRGVTQRIDGFAGHWRDEAKAACRATYVDHVQSDQQHDRRMLCLERGSRQVAALATELAKASSDAVQRAVAATEATLPDLDTCSHTETMVFGLEPPPPGVATKVAAVREQLARALALEQLGRDEDALVAAREAGVASARLKYPAVEAEALVQIARALDRSQTADRRREAEGLYFQALDIAEAARHDQLTATIWSRLVVLGAEMESGIQQVLERWHRADAAVRRIGNPTYDRAKVHHMRGEIYYRDGKYADAEREENAAIDAIASAPEQQLELSRYRDALANALERQGRLDEAVHLHERALNVAREALGPAHPDVIKRQLNYAVALKKQRQFDRARSELEAALANIAERYRSASLDAGRAHVYLSEVSYEEDKLDDAAAHGREALQIYERCGAPDSRRVEAYLGLANVELKRKNFAEALVGYEAALAIRRRILAPDHYQIGVTEGSIAEALVGLLRYDDAAPHVREAERILDHGAKSDPTMMAWILTIHGEVLAGQQQLGAAVPVLERALPIFEKSPDPYNQALASWALAQALHRLGKDPDRVRQLAEQARARFAGLGTYEAARRVAVEQFIERLTAPAPSSSVPGRRLAR